MSGKRQNLEKLLQSAYDLQQRQKMVPFQRDQTAQESTPTKTTIHKLLDFVEHPLFVTPAGIVGGLVGIFIYPPVLFVCGICLLLAFHRVGVVKGKKPFVQITSYAVLFAVTTSVLYIVGLQLKKHTPVAQTQQSASSAIQQLPAQVPSQSPSANPQPVVQPTTLEEAQKAVDALVKKYQDEHSGETPTSDWINKYFREHGIFIHVSSSPRPAVLDNVHIEGFGSTSIENNAGELNLKGGSSVSGGRIGLDNRNPNAKINLTERSTISGGDSGVIMRGPKKEKSKQPEPKPHPPLSP